MSVLSIVAMWYLCTCGVLLVPTLCAAIADAPGAARTLGWLLIGAFLCGGWLVIAYGVLLIVGLPA